MSKQILQAGSTSGTIRGQINNNFSEIYTNVTSISSDLKTINTDASYLLTQTTGTTTPRTLENRFTEIPILNVKDFGAVGDGVTDDTAAIQRAINTNKKIYFPAGTYMLTSHITVSGSAFKICGDGFESCIKSMNASGFIHAGNPKPVDLTYPTPSYIGPMSGSAFYCTNSTYFTTVENLRFEGFKFAFAFLESHNTPRFINCQYYSCNAFVFCYSGSQNYYYDGISGGQSGPVHISSATCHPQNSPYANLDNYYTDSLTFNNNLLGQTNGGTANSTFDAWFQESILRPTTGSYTVGASNYVYPFSTSEEETKPSGWAVAYVPVRNPRAIFGPIFRRIDTRGGGDYGVACINGGIWNAVIDEYNYENEISLCKQHFIFGAVHDLYCKTVNNSVRFNTPVPIIKYTGNGYNSGQTEVDNSNTIWINCDVVPPVYNQVSLPILGAARGNCTFNRFKVGSNEITGFKNKPIDYDSRPSGAIVSTIDWRWFGTHLIDGRLNKAWNFGATLPYKTSDGYYRKTISINPNDGDIASLISLDVMNLTTGEMDNGKYWIQTGNTYNLTLSADVNNGDSYIYVTGQPPRDFQRFSKFTLNSTTVTLKSWDSVNSRLIVEGVVSGMASTALSGSVISKNQYSITPIEPMNRGFVDIQFGNVPYAGSDALGITSLVSTFSNSLTQNDQSVYITGSLSNMDTPYIKYRSAAPTTGKWLRGAIIWNDSPSASLPMGWMCVQSGTPGIWKAMGNLEA